MKQKRVYFVCSIFLLTAGILFMLVPLFFTDSLANTGNAHSTADVKKSEYASPTSFLLGIGMITISSILLTISWKEPDEIPTAESRSFSFKSNSIDRLLNGAHDEKRNAEHELYQELTRALEISRSKHKTNHKFLNALRAIEKVIEKDHLEFYNPNISYHDKENKILKRERRWIQALSERETDFQEIPFHCLETLVDLPDSGRFLYRPLVLRRAHKTPDGTLKITYDSNSRQKESKWISLEVYHYTEDKSVRGILQEWKNKSDDIFHSRKGTGWTFFTATPVPEGYKNLRSVREVLGTGTEPHSPDFFRKSAEYQRARDPRRYIKFIIRVPKERVFVEDMTYKDPAGNRFQLTKYAIAGAISYADIVSMPATGMYACESLIKQDPKRNFALKERRFDEM